jgi:uncharacterized protein (TIGR02266 family)
MTMGAALKLVEPMDTEAAIQRRRFQRAVAYLCIDLCSEHNFWTGLTMNISEGGVFVATNVMLPIGSVVGLHVELPKGTRILALGEVRWCRPSTGNDDVPPGLGIQFVGLDQPSMSAIRCFVTTVREPMRVDR